MYLITKGGKSLVSNFSLALLYLNYRRSPKLKWWKECVTLMALGHP